MRMRTTHCLLLLVLCAHSLLTVAFPVAADQMAHRSQHDALDKAFQRLDQAQAKAVAPTARWMAFDGEKYRLDSSTSRTMALIAYNGGDGQVRFGFATLATATKPCAASPMPDLRTQADFVRGSIRLSIRCVQGLELLVPSTATGKARLAQWIGNGFPPHHVAGTPTKFDLSGNEVMFAALGVHGAAHDK
ncbi:hypothetical protein [Pinirhizobacter soli]|uniref:hypothetical protein n=1 Tax=Pinirhizobacter soli TaxID=2786953 RepID=UPI00202AAF0D|nr:hypothetical protein [Pinirhizobacter soli]